MQQITEQIREGQLVRGQKLPTELRLSETYGVSRAVVREAVRTLDTMGLVESRRGSGSYVRNDQIPSITRGLSFSVTLEEQSVSLLFEFRAVLEANAARFAALRATPKQVASIQEAAAESMVAAQARDVLAFRVADDAFHESLSVAAGNAYLGVSVTAVRHMQNDVTHLITPMRGSMGAAEEHRAHRRRRSEPAMPNVPRRRCGNTSITVRDARNGRVKTGRQKCVRYGAGGLSTSFSLYGRRTVGIHTTGALKRADARKRRAP